MRNPDVNYVLYTVDVLGNERVTPMLCLELFRPMDEQSQTKLRMTTMMYGWIDLRAGDARLTGQPTGAACWHGALSPELLAEVQEIIAGAAWQ